MRDQQQDAGRPTVGGYLVFLIASIVLAWAVFFSGWFGEELLNLMRHGGGSI